MLGDGSTPGPRSIASSMMDASVKAALLSTADTSARPHETAAVAKAEADRAEAAALRGVAAAVVAPPPPPPASPQSTLPAMCGRLRDELGLAPTLTTKQVVDSACDAVGVACDGPLIQRARTCLEALASRADGTGAASARGDACAASSDRN